MRIMALAAAALLLAGCSSAPTERAAETAKPKRPAQAPAVYRVLFDTSKGPFTVEVTREWAPRGASAPLGTYVRFGAVGGIGGGASGLSGRTDLLARFTLDPFRASRWAPYATGGVSAVYGEDSRTSLLLLLGIEGPARGGLAPAIEFGFGGGFRVGVALRQAFPRRR